MRFTGIYNPKQLALLSEALEDYCADLGIDPASPEREDASGLVMALFRDGAQTREELKTALAALVTGMNCNRVERVAQSGLVSSMQSAPRISKSSPGGRRGRTRANY